MSSFLKHILTQLCGQGTLTSEFSICSVFLRSLSEAGEDGPGGKYPLFPRWDAQSGHGLDAALRFPDRSVNSGRGQAALAWQGLTRGGEEGAEKRRKIQPYLEFEPLLPRGCGMG